jgi:hypothetical protein
MHRTSVLKERVGGTRSCGTSRTLRANTAIRQSARGFKRLLSSFEPAAFGLPSWGPCRAVAVEHRRTAACPPRRHTFPSRGEGLALAWRVVVHTLKRGADSHVSACRAAHGSSAPGDGAGSPDMWSDVDLASQPEEFYHGHLATRYPAADARGGDGRLRLSVPTTPGARARTADDMLRRYQSAKPGTRFSFSTR